MDDASARQLIRPDDGLDEPQHVFRPAGIDPVMSLLAVLESRADADHGAGIATSPELLREPLADAAAVREDQASFPVPARYPPPIAAGGATDRHRAGRRATPPGLPRRDGCAGRAPAPRAAPSSS